MKRSTTYRVHQIIAPAAVIFFCYAWAGYMLDHVGSLVN